MSLLEESERVLKSQPRLSAETLGVNGTNVASRIITAQSAHESNFAGPYAPGIQLSIIHDPRAIGRISPLSIYAL